MGSPYQLLVRTEAEKRRIALLEDSRLLEYYEEAADEENLIQAILVGRVERVLPDIKAAFVRIGLKQNGFLPLREAESYHRTSGNEALMSGQEIIVQIKKAPKGGKGAFLTRDVALAGQYVLLMPCNRFVGLSKRIEEAGERRRASELGNAIAAERFGLIVRHAALYAREEDVRAEAEDLWQRWQTLRERAACTRAPAFLWREPSVSEVLTRDYSGRHSIVRCDIPEETERLWNAFRVDEQVCQALARRVDLPNGGSLIIDEREALHTIDVNSGRAVKAAAGMSLALEENLAAVDEIARQIRLRNLGGIILVDFIDMDTEKERAQVLEAMQAALQDDRVKNVIHGFTHLGMLEMTRKRTSDSLRDALTIPCSACCETGRIRCG